MKSAIVHVGPHKTGSTYLQACFHRSAAALRERGIVLPSAWNAAPGNASQTKLLAGLADDAAVPAARAYIEQLFRDGGDTLLISAEDLITLQAVGLQRLRTLLAGGKVTIVYYVRRWSDMLPSGWQERIKHGETVSFPEHLAVHVRNPSSSQLFNLDLKLGQLSEVFGPDSVRLVCYSVLRDADRNLFGHFAQHFLGWSDAAPPLAESKLNASRGIREIELLRRLNMIARQRGAAQSATLRNRLDANWQKLETGPILAAMEQSMRTIRFSDAFPMLRGLHEELHEKYRPSIVPPTLPRYFFRSIATDIEFVDDDFLLLPGVLDRISRIYDALVPAAEQAGHLDRPNSTGLVLT